MANAYETYADWLDNALRHAKRNGIPVKDVAAAIGKHPVVLSAARKGARNLSYDELVVVADKAGVPPPKFASVSAGARQRMSLATRTTDDFAKMKEIEQLFLQLDADTQAFLVARLGKLSQ